MALAGCSEPLPADHDDGGSPTLPGDGGLGDDGATPDRCAPHEIVRHPDVLLDQAVVGSDGRVAITWLQTDVTGDFSETRAFLEIVGAQGTSEVIAAKIADTTLVAIEGGYASPTGSPTPAMHVLDLDGVEARAPIAMPGSWQLGPALASEGRRLRGEAWSSSVGSGGLVFELDLDAASPAPQAITDAASGVVARRFDRELVAVGAEAVLERALPTGTTSEEIAWPAGIEPITAELDVAHDRWLVLGEERITDGAGGMIGNRPAIVSVPRDGGAVEVRSIEVDVMRSVAGSLAIGPDAAVFAVDDLHGNAYLVRMPLDTLEPSEAEPLDGIWAGRVLWHEATESFALVSVTPRGHDGTTAIEYRCGL